VTTSSDLAHATEKDHYVNMPNKFLNKSTTALCSKSFSLCPVLLFLKEFSNHRHCISRSAASWYAIFASSQVGVYHKITGAVFGRIMSAHASVETSGITKSRVSCSGSKYTINPKLLKLYISEVSSVSGTQECHGSRNDKCGFI